MDREEYRSRLAKDVKSVNRGQHGSIFYDDVLAENYSEEMAPLVVEHLADDNDTVRSEVVLFLDKVKEASAVDQIRDMDIRSSYVVGVACIEYLKNNLQGDDLVYALLSMFDRSINNELNYEIVLNLQDIVDEHNRDFIVKLHDKTGFSKKPYLEKLVDKIDGKLNKIEDADMFVDNSEYDEQIDEDGGLQKSFADFISRNGYRLRMSVR